MSEYREVRIHRILYEKAERYAKAYRLAPEDIIEAALGMTVPDAIGNTAPMNEIELNLRANAIARDRKKE